MTDAQQSLLLLAALVVVVMLLESLICDVFGGEWDDDDT